MSKKIKNNILPAVDYIKSLEQFHSIKTIKRLIYAVNSYLKQDNIADNIITIKIGTEEHCLSVSDTVILLSSIEEIIKNICVALGYEPQDIHINLINAGPGCFAISLIISITKGAVAKYATGFIEEFCNIDLEKEGRRQAKMIKEIFEKFLSTPKIKNAESPEAQNIKTAKSKIFKTLDNENFSYVNFTNNPENKIPRSRFIDYII